MDLIYCHLQTENITLNKQDNVRIAYICALLDQEYCLTVTV